MDPSIITVTLCLCGLFIFRVDCTLLGLRDLHLSLSFLVENVWLMKWMVAASKLGNNWSPNKIDQTHDMTSQQLLESLLITLEKFAYVIYKIWVIKDYQQNKIYFKVILHCYYFANFFLLLLVHNKISDLVKVTSYYNSSQPCTIDPCFCASCFSFKKGRLNDVHLLKLFFFFPMTVYTIKDISAPSIDLTMKLRLTINWRSNIWKLLR